MARKRRLKMIVGAAALAAMVAGGVGVANASSFGSAGKSGDAIVLPDGNGPGDRADDQPEDARVLPDWTGPGKPGDRADDQAGDAIVLPDGSGKHGDRADDQAEDAHALPDGSGKHGERADDQGVKPGNTK
ncbi:hypothetical protein [Streptomyces sp. 6N106]|uniref:hypothetical protein n=1 Tax=Streptomyces sp. 6N106 TaxID=3457418 RepID=UPI003FD3360E